MQQNCSASRSTHSVTRDTSWTSVGRTGDTGVEPATANATGEDLELDDGRVDGGLSILPHIDDADG